MFQYNIQNKAAIKESAKIRIGAPKMDYISMHGAPM